MKIIKLSKYDFQKPVIYKYYINLDERGMFYADVRNLNDKTIFEIKINPPYGVYDNIFENGYMKHKNDLKGLEEYLKQLGIMEKRGILEKGN